MSGATAFPDGPVLRQEGRIVVYDHGWQMPAMTERHAYLRLRAAGSLPEGLCYAAFPWATLFDKCQMQAPDLDVWLGALDRFRARLPRDRVLVTVCQHIRLQDFMLVMQGAGIAHVFWSHTTRSSRVPVAHWPELHPFPLYPVQSAQPSQERPTLFTFVGARADSYYLSPVRNWILNILGGHPEGLVIGRDRWHFDRYVHEYQVRGERREGQDAEALIDPAASAEFAAGLGRSVFSLCPSGTGPNSIRLWESLGAGCIPVILSRDHALPGGMALWREAAVLSEETPEAVRALPGRLRRLADEPGRRAAMQAAGARLWARYGPDGFVSDILEQAPALAAGGRTRPALSGEIPGANALPDALLGASEVGAGAEDEARLRRFLSVAAARLLADGPAAFEARPDLQERIAAGLGALPAEDPLARHLRAVAGHAGLVLPGGG